LIENAKHDTDIVNAWTAWDNIIYISDPALDFTLNQNIDSICDKNLAKNVSESERLFYMKSKGFALNNLGLIYQDRGQFVEAINCYTISLKLREEIEDKNGIAMSLNNIGNIYMRQADYDKAFDYHSRSLKIRKEIDDKLGMANSYNNLGVVYYSIDNPDSAIVYYSKSSKIKEELGDKRGAANTLNNIGIIYNDLGQYDEAMEVHTKSLRFKEEIGDRVGMTYSLCNIGRVYNKLGQYDKALDYGEQSLALAQEIGHSTGIRDASGFLYELNKILGRFEECLKMFELYITTRDNMLSEENQKAILQQEYKHAYEKQAAKDSVKAAETGKVKDAELMAEKAEKKQIQQQQYFLYAGLFLALIFGGFIYNRFKLANKQKAIIEDQKQKVDEAYDGLEEAHKEITDSIDYAERIQRSFLATSALLDANLNEYFVFFQPKDVVSGDFYWAGELANGNFAIVNADSTGHGVPGAIMSILNISSIESAVKDKLTEPAAIFNDTRKTIIERLKKDGSVEGGKDGMDASLLCFNQEKTRMTYVAAQNPIWIIRAGEMIEIKPEKMPIGKHDKDNVPFKGGEHDIQKGDLIYTLTDGFQDQFGGPKGKKFMVKKMREYVLSISILSLKEQEKKITEVFAKWKGDLEQVDDVCVIGIKI